MARSAEPNTTALRSSRGFRVGAQKDRYDEELLIMGGRFDLDEAAMGRPWDGGPGSAAEVLDAYLS